MSGSVSWGLRMTRTANRGARIGLAAILVFGICGETAARSHRTHVRHLRARGVMLESHAQLVARPAAQPGALRYYGGPKSPMWRGPAEN